LSAESFLHFALNATSFFFFFASTLLDGIFSHVLFTESIEELDEWH
jgi:hypothetical protein